MGIRALGFISSFCDASRALQDLDTLPNVFKKFTPCVIDTAVLGEFVQSVLFCVSCDCGLLLKGSYRSVLQFDIMLVHSWGAVILYMSGWPQVYHTWWPLS